MDFCRLLGVQIEASHSTIGGGSGNTVETHAFVGTIAGGHQNTIGAFYGTIAGGYANSIQNGAAYSQIGGGEQNTIGAFYGTIAGGYANSIQNGAAFSHIGGGEQNTIPTMAEYATIPGGKANSATNYAFAAGRRAKANHMGSFVWADSTDADFSSTGNNQFLIRAAGGVGIGGAPADAMLDVRGNVRVNDFDLFLRGGNDRNHGLGWHGSGKLFAGQNVDGPVLYGWSGGALGPKDGGQKPSLTWDRDARVAIDPGNLNTGSVTRASLTFGPGNSGEGIGSRRTTGGNQNGLDFYTAYQPRLSIANNGHVGIGTPTPAAPLHVIGEARATVFTATSDRDTKENFTPVDAQAVLAKVAALPITQWNFKAFPGTPHIGPTAQDFHAAFSLGSDDKHIAMVDAGGVSLAAIQALHQKVEAETAALRAENAELTRTVHELKSLVQALNQQINRGAQ